MKERPILFSAPMVRAILDGSKTQTRRIAKGVIARHARTGEALSRLDSAGLRVACPYGQPGNRLWVREACCAEELPAGEDGVRYLADDTFNTIAYTQSAAEKWLTMHWYRGRRAATVPPIHMPRWASRIDLLISSVRVERLQDISETDALAEGITYGQLPDNPQDLQRARTWYRGLWEQINGAGSWEANPWVWVVEFTRMTP